ncbi:MAG: FixH family protein [Nonlabens sp.]
MKINWGTGLVIGMALFIAFILYFVIRISTDHDQNHDLVTEGYYQKEMELQEDIYAEQNTAGMTEKITGRSTPKGYVLTFPEAFEPAKIKGKVAMYRPSNKVLDFEIPLEMSTSRLIIPASQLPQGRWNITMDWSYEGKKYKFKKQIVY